MPRVPVYEQQVGLRPAGIAEQQNLDVTKNQRALAGALVQTGDVIDRIDMREANSAAQQAQIEVRDRWSAFDAELRNKYKGGNVDVRGENGEVVDSVEQQTENFWKAEKERLTKALNPRARQIAAAQLANIQGQAINQTRQYGSRERERHQTEVFTGFKQTEIQSAAASGDPTKADAAATLIQAENAKHAALYGRPPEWVAAETQKDLQVLHSSMVRGLLEGDNPERAREYLDKHKDQLGAMGAELATKVDNVVADVNGRKMADSLANLPYAEALTQVSAIEDPKVRKAARLQLQQNEADKVTIRAGQEKAASDAVWQQVAQGVPLSKLPRAVMDQMDGRERVALVDHYAAEARRRITEAKEGSVKTNMATLEDIYALPKDEFLKLRISTLQDKLSRADQEELIKRQAKLREPGEDVKVATREQQVAAAMDLLKLDSKDQAKKGLFRKAFNDQVAVFAAEQKREPNYTESQEILSRLTRERKAGWFSTQRYFEAVGTGDAAKFDPPPAQAPGTPARPAQARSNTIVNINGSDRALITKALRAEGVTITEDAIQQRYRQAKGVQ